MMGTKANREEFLRGMQGGGIDGGIVFSPSPPSFQNMGAPTPAEARWESVLRLTAGSEHLFPFFWIDPLEHDALAQVARAVEAGISGFKVICNRFFPGNRQALEVFQAIADAGKPLFFHSGILWDGTPSSDYNRPAGFEALMGIEGLRFAMAHIAWPWCDELIAVYGKLQSARKHGSGAVAELFIDVTPGTPPIYREEALTKLYTVGYHVEDNVFFGTDYLVEDYKGESASKQVAMDNIIYTKLGLSSGAVNKVYGDNLLRFVGKRS